jgi:hypothetical protein
METLTTDAQAAALRALLIRDAPTATQLTAALGDDGTAGYQRLADAALSIAATRRFAPRFTTADIVPYVASVRTSRRADGAQYDFSPAAAENVLRYALGQALPRTPDPAERLRAAIALLAALTETELSTEADVDSLLAEARTLADQWPPSS